VFLLTSAQESFGLAALEAMACEVPVLASKGGGLPEVGDHRVQGVLAAPDDFTGMAQSVAHFLLDERMRRQFAAAAKKAAHARYCDTAIVPMYEAYYRETIEALAGRRHP